MKTIIILVVIGVFLFFSRNYITGLLIHLIKKYKNRAKGDDVVKEQGVIFAPQGTIRTFNVSIEIQEIGDGTAKISLTKLKTNDVT